MSDNYITYRQLIEKANPPFIPFVRIILEELSDISTDPLAPTISTRHYKAYMNNAQIRGEDKEERKPEEIKSDLEKYITVGQSGTYVFEKTSFDFTYHIEHFMVWDYEKIYERSYALEARKDAQLEVQTVDNRNWILLGTAAIIMIGVGFYYYHQKRKI